MYYATICAIVKNENGYINEWVQYHRKLGFEYFIIYDNNSDIPLKKTLSSFIRERVLEVQEFSDTDGPQLKAYNDCLIKFLGRTRWLAFIDVDEFITLKKKDNIKNFLIEYERYAGICLNWLIYNANGHIKKENKPMEDLFTRHIHKSAAINKHIKTIVQPDKIEHMANAHNAKCKPGYIQVNERKKPVLKGYSYYTDNKAFIRHFFTRSYEEWVEKLNRGRVATALTQKPEHHFWLYNPDLLDQKYQAQKKYLKSISKYLTLNDLYNQTSKKWPVFADKNQLSQITSIITLIAGQLLREHAVYKTPGLYNGKTGIGLFFFNYFKFTGNELYQNKARELCVIDFDIASPDQSMESGIGGIAWGIEYLSQNQFIYCMTNDYFKKMDSVFSQSLDACTDISMSSGLISYGLYFLSRMSSLSYSTNYEYNVMNGRKNLELIVERLGDMYLKSGDNSFTNSDNLDKFNNCAPLIRFLLKTYELNIHRDISKKIIDREVDLFIKWHETQCQHLEQTDVLWNWNYRKLTIVSVLITAAKILDRPSLVSLARQIILETKNRQGLSMGLKAIADDIHVLIRLYHQTNFPELKIKIIQSVDLFLQQYVLSSGFSDPGIQNGWAGIGLILLATISSVEPTWDKMFLLSDY